MRKKVPNNPNNPIPMKFINPDIVLKPVKEDLLMAVGMLMYSFGWIG